VKGYLLDTNHVAALCNRSPKIVAQVSSLPADSQFRACTISLGEFEFGNRATQTTDQPKRDAATAFLNQEFLPNALPISTSTRIYYAEIIARIWKQQTPVSGKRKTERHLVELGVDTNDVWIAAVAWEHGLILVTSDKMECIRSVVPELQWDCWT